MFSGLVFLRVEFGHIGPVSRFVIVYDPREPLAEREGDAGAERDEDGRHERRAAHRPLTGCDRSPLTGCDVRHDRDAVPGRRPMQRYTCAAAGGQHAFAHLHRALLAHALRKHADGNAHRDAHEQRDQLWRLRVFKIHGEYWPSLI